MNPIAHILPLENGSFVEQPLSGLNGHLEGVAELAEKFASSFGAQEFAKLAGLWHDLGKYKPDFQDYIRLNSGYQSDLVNDGGCGKVDHTAAGALLAIEKHPIWGQLLSYLIAGHHTGLPDYYKDKVEGSCLNDRMRQKNHLEQSKRGTIPSELLNLNFSDHPENGICTRNDKGLLDARQLHLWLRMLYSCLVDADFLDTEQFMSPEQSGYRGNDITLEELQRKYNEFMAEMTKKSARTPINEIRAKILRDCRNAAEKDPGFFSLTVPTGGGKTLASMGFALDHAIKHGFRRIIVAIPFTSIIEQTADVLRSVFGENAVLEHHCNLDPEKETVKSRLATENWDAPIIVTTNVQLFQSLFAAKSSSCRKLHNIMESVIILDEAQTLPSDFLKPILSVMKGLVDYFKTTIVLCTATQPALEGHIGSPTRGSEGGFEGIEKNAVREIMTDANLSDKMSRTKVSYIDKVEEWADLAEKLMDYDQVLCIVNTRKDCRELHSLMPEGTIHLSALMCGEHRSKIIAFIKEKLKNKEPIRVVSTQLVEAGVDIDFPVVFRATAGLDSIAQAAGRCNREGLREKGNVFVFETPQQAPQGFLRFGEDAFKDMMNSVFTGNQIELLPEYFKKYFEKLFYRVNSFDKDDVLGDLTRDAVCCENQLPKFKIQFRTAAENFQLIDDKGQKNIIVWYSGKYDSRDLLEKIKIDGPKRELMRHLQRFSVNIPKKLWQEYQKAGYIEKVKTNDGELDLWCQVVPELYDYEFGLSLNGPKFKGDEFIC